MSCICDTSTLLVTTTEEAALNQPICDTAHGWLVATQTGALLVAIGSLLMNLYPFREHVDPHTAELLVKIGRKLSGA